MKKKPKAYPEHTGSIPNSWEFDSGKEGPTVTILGAVHGNEVVGVEIIQSLLEYFHENLIQAGKLRLALGNVDAYNYNKRYIQCDLNRLFGPLPVDPSKITPEHERAEELKIILEDTDLLIDLHSTIKPSQPFIVIPSESKLSTQDIAHTNLSLLNIVQALGTKTVLYGKGFQHPDGIPVYADTFVMSQGGAALTLEAGWSQSPETKEAKLGVYNTLKLLGMMAGEVASQEVHQTLWQAYRNVIATSTFEFVKDFKNFEFLPAGTIYATDLLPMRCGFDEREFFVEVDSSMIFPKKNIGSSGPKESWIVEGEEACILAKKVNE